MNARDRRRERRNRMRRYRAACRASETTTCRLAKFLAKMYGMSRIDGDASYCAPGTFSVEDWHGTVSVCYSVEDSAEVLAAMRECTSRKRRHTGFLSPSKSGSLAPRNERMRGVPFGINCWRRVLNGGGAWADGVEFSLCGEAPPEVAAMLTERGWKWNNLLARWYISLSRATEDEVRQVVDGLLHLRREEDVIGR